MMDSIATLGEYFDYDPDTGFFFWRCKVGKHHWPGTRAGCLSQNGYWFLRIKRKTYLAHRVAWALMTGKWPTGEIDHINRERSDNRWLNLRQVTSSENKFNSRQRPSKTGVRGVNYSRGKYQAQISIRGRLKFLGRYPTIEQAEQAYKEAALNLYPRIKRAA